MFLINFKRHYMNRTKWLLSFCILLFTTIITANDIYHINGTVYKNVNNFKDLGDYFAFDHDGQSYSFPKHRIKRVNDDNGNIIYRLERLKAVKEGEDPKSLKYVFLRNNKEVA